MADTKLSALSAISSLALEDLLYVVDDPSGTPAEKKTTVSDLADLLAIEQALGKDYFCDLGLLPANTLFEAINDLPARNISLNGGGTVTDNGSFLDVISAAGYENLYGWDTGASRSEILAIFGGVRPPAANAGNFAITIGATAPTLPAWNSDCYWFAGNSAGMFGGNWYGTDFTTYWDLNTAGNVAPPGVTDKPQQGMFGMAMYWDGAADEIHNFVRFGGQWWRIGIVSNSALSNLRYVCARIDMTYPATAGSDHASFGCPLAIYYA